MNSCLLTRDALEKRREINIQIRLKKLGNIKKPLGHIKAHKEKMGKDSIALLVLNYRNNPTKLKDEIREVKEVSIKNDLFNIDNYSRRCDTCNIVVHRAS